MNATALAHEESDYQVSFRKADRSTKDRHSVPGSALRSRNVQRGRSTGMHRRRVKRTIL